MLIFCTSVAGVRPYLFSVIIDYYFTDNTNAVNQVNVIEIIIHGIAGKSWISQINGIDE